MQYFLGKIRLRFGDASSYNENVNANGKTRCVDLSATHKGLGMKSWKETVYLVIVRVRYPIQLSHRKREVLSSL